MKGWAEDLIEIAILVVGGLLAWILVITGITIFYAIYMIVLIGVPVGIVLLILHWVGIF